MKRQILKVILVPFLLISVVSCTGSLQAVSFNSGNSLALVQEAESLSLTLEEEMQLKQAEEDADFLTVPEQAPSSMPDLAAHVQELEASRVDSMEEEIDF